jgi:hypothetical protein
MSLAHAAEHHQFRQLVSGFVQRTVIPAHQRW